MEEKQLSEYADEIVDIFTNISSELYIHVNDQNVMEEEDSKRIWSDAKDDFDMIKNNIMTVFPKHKKLFRHFVNQYGPTILQKVLLDNRVYLCKHSEIMFKLMEFLDIDGKFVMENINNYTWINYLILSKKENQDFLKLVLQNGGYKSKDIVYRLLCEIFYDSEHLIDVFYDLKEQKLLGNEERAFYYDGVSIIYYIYQNLFYQRQYDNEVYLQNAKLLCILIEEKHITNIHDHFDSISNYNAKGYNHHEFFNHYFNLTMFSCEREHPDITKLFILLKKRGVVLSENSLSLLSQEVRDS